MKIKARLGESMWSVVSNKHYDHNAGLTEAQKAELMSRQLWDYSDVQHELV